MTAKTDLENAVSILEAGITAHVGALKSARDAARTAQSAANDDTFVKTMTSKVLALADTLNSSVDVLQPAVAAPAVEATVVAPVAPTAPVTPAVAPVAPQAAVVTPVLQNDPGATPAMIAAAIASQQKASPASVGSNMLHDLEAALAKLTK